MNGQLDPESLERNGGEFTQLLASYAQACEVPDSGHAFMPQVWRRIEAKRQRSMGFERAARSVFACAVALSLVLGAFLIAPARQPSIGNESFVEVLASANASGNGTFFEPVRLELTAPEHPRR